MDDMKRSRSRALLRRAKRVIPGGVNSPVRAYDAVGGSPPFIVRGRGARIHDADGNEFIDYVGSWGPLILAHAHPAVRPAVAPALRRGTSFGAPTEGEIELAERIVSALPSVEKLRLVNSGTEAVMSAIRLARAVTGRRRVLKFEGCYHGHSDGLLVGAGSGLATLGIPGSPGVPEEMTRLTLQVPYNDLEATRRALRRWGRDTACVIVEPVAGNMGLVEPQPGFLEGLRALCDESGALLIFDEVITGFRVGWDGAQGYYGVRPDLTCLGKVVGGGLPLAAYGGRRVLMNEIAPEGEVYQAGTLSGNPLAVAAGLATLGELERPGVYEKLAALSSRLVTGLGERAEAAGVDFHAWALGGVFGFAFHPGPVRNFGDARRAHLGRFRRFFDSMLQQGVYLAPSAFESGFVSLAHRRKDLDETLDAAETAFYRAARLR
jgi:glutamate-1-semialdehyde 2,1-aminomutase